MSAAMCPIVTERRRKRDGITTRHVCTVAGGARGDCCKTTVGDEAARGIDYRIGLGVAWNKEDPTASRDDIVDFARSLARAGR